MHEELAGWLLGDGRGVSRLSELLAGLSDRRCECAGRFDLRGIDGPRQAFRPAGISRIALSSTCST